MATKTEIKDDLKSDHKEKLFNDFFHSALGTMEALEQHYNVTGVVNQIFGNDGSNRENEDQAKSSLRNSYAWTELSALYDYAMHGIVSNLDGPDSVVINGSDVLKLASSEEYWTSAEWDAIIAMGDGRFALDDGEDITIFKLSLLAKVDMRTVRNAISAGHLVANKRNTLLEGEQICVENASARRWLHGRKSFKPTVVPGDAQHLSLKSVNGPAEFGAFLVSQRKRIGLNNDAGKLVVLHNCVDPKAIAQLEAGIFSLPLDAVFPLADFYQVGRKELLDCVMRVFFVDELIMLSSTVTDQRGDKK
ncbi:MAG: hypothetical protein Q7T21_09255 [Gallionella sp.]|nr:hypothetical protein [Gallionella sp.]